MSYAAIVINSDLRVALTSGIFDVTQIYDDDLSDADLRMFRSFKNIREIAVGASPNFSGNGLKHLTTPTSVVYLYIHNPSFTDESARALSRFTSVRHMGLNDAKITSEALAHLQPLSVLSFLDLSSTRVTDRTFDSCKPR
jgi:hypothetical protein